MTLRAVTVLALVYSILHFAASGVRHPLQSSNLQKFDEQATALVEHLRTGEPVHIILPMQYGPVFFFVLHPLLRITGGERAALAGWLYGVQVVCAGLSFLLTCAALKRFVRINKEGWVLVLAWLAILWLNFSPLYTILAENSVETWELLLVSLALYSHLRGWRVATALALAAAGLIKLLPFVFLYYLLLTERRTFIYSCVAVLALLLLGQEVYGPDMGLSYVPHHTGSSLGFSYGLTWHENVSLKAAIAKLFGHLELSSRYYVSLTRPQLTAAIVLGDVSVLTGAALLTHVLRRRAAPRSADIVFWEWSFVAAVMLILSPNTTLEYGVLVLSASSYAFVRLIQLPRQPGLRGTWACFGGALFFLGALVPRSLLNRVTFVSAITKWTGYTYLTPSEAYQYFCFPLVGLVLLAVALWRLAPTQSGLVAAHAS